VWVWCFCVVDGGVLESGQRGLVGLMENCVPDSNHNSGINILSLELFTGSDVVAPKVFIRNVMCELVVASFK